MMFGAWGETPTTTSRSASSTPPLDAGINFVDTADVYSDGESEVIVGKALAGRPRRRRSGHQGRLPDGRRPAAGAAPRGGASSGGVENSLRRLDTDWIDLYQIHRPDPNTDVDETLGALSDLVHQGKIRYIGHSTFPASEIVEAQWTAARATVVSAFRCEQPPYSILTRAIEHDVLPTCQRYGIGVIPYSPLAGGWLSGRYRKDADAKDPTSSARRGRPPLRHVRSRRTSASSTPPNSSPSSPTRPASR